MERELSSNGYGRRRKKKIGTDGVRGRANVEPVTAETALKLGRAAAAHVFNWSEPTLRGHCEYQIVIGKDARLSGDMLENAISSGFLWGCLSMSHSD
jgi:phosphoglucosamine mutase